MPRIILDCFGGDNSPLANVEAAALALNAHDDLNLILTGDQNVIFEKLKSFCCDTSRIEIIHAPDVIAADEKPTDVIRLRKDSSLVKSIETLRADDSIAGMVSVGATGSLVAGAVFRIGRLRGVIRPAFCPVMPTMNGGVVGVCDSGANVECTPDYLQQFAVMGSLYMELVCGVSKPRVALLNVGVETEKGDTLRKDTFARLLTTEGINFVGNMESRDLMSGKYDLVVCDGFSGNVLIKSTEGACLEVLKKLKKDINSRFINKLGALLMRKMFKAEKEFMNYENYGGSVLLGAKKVIVKGHGSSKARGIAKCIEQVYLSDAGNYTQNAEAAIEKLPIIKR